MKKLIFIISTFYFLNSAYCFDQDLDIPNKRFLAKANGFVCDDKNTQTDMPIELKKFHYTFDKLIIDKDRMTALMKASFKVNNSLCHYSSILSPNFTTKIISLVESRSYSNDENVDCSLGQDTLDNLINNVSYWYYGLPQKLALKVTSQSSQRQCNGDHIGIQFRLSGFVL